MRRAVFLDRDGVINSMVYYPELGVVDSPSIPDEFELLPGAVEAVRQINELGLLAIVVSNQPGVAKGRHTRSLLDATTQKMESELAKAGAWLDGVYYCLHHPKAILDAYRGNCDCRKPRPGLLLQAAREWNIDLKASYLVGDGVMDVQAGKAVGATTCFVSSRKCYVCDELARQDARPNFMVDNLAEAVEVIDQLEAVRRGEGRVSVISLSRYTPTCATLTAAPDEPATPSVPVLDEAAVALRRAS